MNIKKALGLAAVAGFIAATAPVGQANAVSLGSPVAAVAATGVSGNITTEVRWRRHYGWRGHRGWHRHYGWRHRWHHRRRW